MIQAIQTAPKAILGPRVSSLEIELNRCQVVATAIHQVDLILATLNRPHRKRGPHRKS